MPSMLRLSALGCAIAVASAKWTKHVGGTERWEPARETDGVMSMGSAGWAPKPTTAPSAELVEMELKKRDRTSTCGYYAEFSSSAAVMCVGTAQCIENESDMAVGCCGSENIQDCSIPTVCYPSRSASLYTSLNVDYTLLCTSAEYPNCVTYSYDQYDPLYAGYMALGCGVSAGTYSVEYYAPVLGSAATLTRATSSSFDASSSSPELTSTSSPESASTVTGGSSRSSTSVNLDGQTTTPSPVPTQSSSTPIGAIVGGVVGGIGGLALLGLLIFFLVRHSKKSSNGSTPTTAAAAQTSVYYAPGPGPNPSVNGQGTQMSQTPHQFSGYPPAGFVAADNRTSVAPSTYYPQSPKASHYESFSTTPVSPATSPPPMGFTPPLAGGQQPPHQSYNVTPTPTGQYQSQNPQPGNASELPTGRSDGELRELA